MWGNQFFFNVSFLWHHLLCAVFVLLQLYLLSDLKNAYLKYPEKWREGLSRNFEHFHDNKIDVNSPISLKACGCLFLCPWCWTLQILYLQCVTLRGAESLLPRAPKTWLLISSSLQELSGKECFRTTSDVKQYHLYIRKITMEDNKDRIEVSIIIYYNRCLYLILLVSTLAIATLNKRKKSA